MTPTFQCVAGCETYSKNITFRRTPATIERGLSVVKSLTNHNEDDGGEVEGSDELPLRTRLVWLHLDDGGLQHLVVLICDTVLLLYVGLHVCEMVTEIRTVLSPRCSDMG